MKIIRLTESTTKLKGTLFGGRVDRKQTDILDSLSKQIEEATEGEEILSIQYVEEKKISGRIGYDRSEIGIRSKIESITAYVTIK